MHCIGPMHDGTVHSGTLALYLSDYPSKQDSIHSYLCHSGTVCMEAQY